MRLQNCPTLCAIALLTLAVCDAKILKKRSASSSSSSSSSSGSQAAAAAAAASSNELFTWILNSGADNVNENDLTDLGSTVSLDEDGDSGSTERSEGLISKGIDMVGELTEGTVVGTVDMMQDMLSGIMSFIESIPIIGSMVKSVMDEMDKGMVGSEKLINDFISRLLGGTLPCTISIQYRMQCEGLKKNGGMGKVLRNALLEVPLLPHQFVDIIYFLIETFMDPMMDIIFGGVKTSK